MPFDGGSKVESALRIFGADRALLLIEGVAVAKVVMLGVLTPFAAGGKKQNGMRDFQRVDKRSGRTASSFYRRRRKG